MKLWAVHFTLRALDPVRFPPGKAGNVFRGALGLALQRVAGPGEALRLFEPRRPAGEKGPSGLADLPRPFVLRVAHLDGCAFVPGQPFSFALHLFDAAHPAVDTWTQAISAIAAEGIGPGRGRAEIQSTAAERIELGFAPANPGTVRTLRVHFLTATELKAAGKLAGPEMSTLFSRARDRLATLAALYGSTPLAIDFQSLGEIARSVRTVREDLHHHDLERRSSRTGQTHPLGGFTGTVNYEGPLDSIAPFLEAAAWTGVGRQTVWGKGQIAVERNPPPLV